MIKLLVIAVISEIRRKKRRNVTCVGETCRRTDTKSNPSSGSEQMNVKLERYGCFQWFIGCLIKEQSNEKLKSRIDYKIKFTYFGAKGSETQNE